MRHLGYTPCKADPDLWFKPMTRPDDEFQYYVYILLYVDDSKYVQEAVCNVEIYLGEHFGDRPLPKRATSPWSTDYVSELTPEWYLTQHTRTLT